MRTITDPTAIAEGDDELWRPLGDENVRRLPRRRETSPVAIQEAFMRFHRQNPAVYDTLVRLARQYRDRVGTTPGIGMLWEVMRWTLAIETRDNGVFKLNNNLRSRYSRLIMEQEPDLADAFEVRRLRAA